VTPGNDGWVPLLACPAVAPVIESVITFGNCYITYHSVKLLGEAEPPGMRSQAGAWEREKTLPY